MTWHGLGDFLSKNLPAAAVGTAFGTVVGALWKWVSDQVFTPWYADTRSARRVMRSYALPLWMALKELDIRLEDIELNRDHKGEAIYALNRWPSANITVDWLTGGGYYLASTVYLFAQAICWITLFERDVTMLYFGRNKRSVEFFELIQDVKYWSTATQEGKDSSLYDYYFLGVGQLLAGPDNKPLTFLQFCSSVAEDSDFREYCNRLFWFARNFCEPNAPMRQLASTRNAIRAVTTFLERNGIMHPPPQCVKFDSELHRKNVLSGWNLAE